MGSVLSVFFAIVITFALGFMGSMVQSNSVTKAACSAVNLDYKAWGWIIGIIIAAVSAFIFIGGIQRIASVTEKLVPVMAVLFLIGGLVVLILRIQYLPATIGAIFKYAFTPDALIGGGIGYALKTAISQAAIETAGIAKTNAMQLAFASVLPKNEESIFVAICLLFFAYSTIISWNSFGKINVQYMFKNSKRNK